MVLGTFLTAANGATDVINSGAKAACGTACNDGLSVGGLFAAIANALIFVIGGVAVIMIIVGGLRFVTANGDAKAVESAKNIILYSVMGVIVAIASFAIVSFVTSNIK